MVERGAVVFFPDCAPLVIGLSLRPGSKALARAHILQGAVQERQRGGGQHCCPPALAHGGRVMSQAGVCVAETSESERRRLGKRRGRAGCHFWAAAAPTGLPRSFFLLTRAPLSRPARARLLCRCNPLILHLHTHACRQRAPLRSSHLPHVRASARPKDLCNCARVRAPSLSRAEALHASTHTNTFHIIHELCCCVLWWRLCPCPDPLLGRRA